MVVKFHCLLFIILFIGSVSSRNVQFNGKSLSASATTLPPEKIHLTIHENSYSAEDKYKYINGCVQKCMQNQQPQPKKNIFNDGRDDCIRTQCRISQRRR
jgi:hypothetical protein